ncbi:amino acid ABC transporter permease [Rothia sp. AR01]|uniref:Amino acid ABC transporter permease n=1 Tax=Rothia santali TaxID=2949643 RepID=A0A9X2HA82_9MICC|nr:amino acid ABC transporter permease [Rothia santali]MCP3425571.1 amino acid ABC transporter permease [Rothia santali]
MSTAPTGTSTAPIGTDMQSYRVIRNKHVGRYVAAVITALLLLSVVLSFARADIDWATVGEYLTARSILTGFMVTIYLTIISMAIGIVLGILIAVMRLAHNPVVSWIAWLYVWFFRGTPVYLQLLLWFNIAIVFPRYGIPGLYEGRTVDIVTPLVAAILGLGLNQAAYTSEVVRGGILSVDRGQDEAAKALGLTGLSSMRTVVLPQAMRVILPPIGNETIGMLKTTSLASAIGATEILNEAQHIYLVNNLIIELLIVTAIWYLLAVSVLSVVQYYIEKHFGRGHAAQTAGVGLFNRIQTILGTSRRTP